MRWKPGQTSQDIEDRRGMAGGGGRFSGGRGLGVGGFVILLILSLVFKQDFFNDLSTHSLAICGALAWQGVWFAAILGAVALVAVYFLTVWGAEP